MRLCLRFGCFLLAFLRSTSRRRGGERNGNEAELIFPFLCSSLKLRHVSRLCNSKANFCTCPGISFARLSMKAEKKLSIDTAELCLISAYSTCPLLNGNYTRNIPRMPSIWLSRLSFRAASLRLRVFSFSLQLHALCARSFYDFFSLIIRGSLLSPIADLGGKLGHSAVDDVELTFIRENRDRNSRTWLTSSNQLQLMAISLKQSINLRPFLGAESSVKCGIKKISSPKVTTWSVSTHSSRLLPHSRWFTCCRRADDCKFVMRSFSA